MSLTSNPFYVLDATPSDDRHRIIALANDRRPDVNKGVIQEARNTLLTPRKRLTAEIAWLPGLERKEIRQVLAAKDKHPDCGRWFIRLPALTRANLMADGLVEVNPVIVSSSELAAWIVDFAATHDRIQAEEVTTIVNQARLKSDIPMESQQDVTEELQGRHNHFRDAIERCMNGLAFVKMVEVVTLIVNQATQEGICHAPPLIDNLVDSYYDRKVREKMAARRREIGKLVSRIRRRVSVDVVGIVTQIEREVKAWNVMTQPIQMSLASRGRSHSPSDEIVREVRDLAIDLLNKHGLLDLAQRLIKTLREAFAEMEQITKLLDKDVSTLGGLTSNVKATRSQGSDVARDSRPTHTAETHRMRPPSWKSTAWYLPGCIILVLSAITANLETSVEWPRTLASTYAMPFQPNNQDPELQQRVYDEVAYKDLDLHDDVHTEMEERIRWMLTGKGNASPEFVQSAYHRGVADDYVTTRDKSANFTRSVLQGGMNVPRILLEALGIPTLEAEDIGSSWWTWQDPRLRDAFFSSKLPYTLGHVAVATAAYVLLIFVGRMTKRIVGRDPEN